ncbi:PIR Superfamily Protein [Plasmodium ovale wallikeri]|uniref:PIR Superfamily Protein n=2 Tax=Plasmodium ovale TaxID=36330 RepID=A0A1A9A5W2_PLAOA|nr:PIR Superfamily Protein [Plasmodium ovale wallikeri]SBT54099.1 PIR Superfamily Protein [Plasmodium ovale wallikeri]SBT72779.1 PIR protein [Plasmodium ovale]
MATVRVVSTSSADTSRRDKCINLLSDIQLTVTNKIAELHATKEEDEKFVQLCEYLGEYLDFYEDDIEECYEDGFSYLYETIISLLKDELTKSPKYNKCIQKLTTKKKEYLDPKYETNDSLKEENGFKDSIIKLEKEIKKIFKRIEISAETEKSFHEQGKTDKQGTSEAYSILPPSISLGDHIPEEPGSKVLDSGVHKAEEIDTKHKSTLNHSENAGTGDQQSTLLPTRANNISNPRNTLSLQNLDNAGLSSAVSLESNALNSIPKQELPCKEEECSASGSSQYERSGEHQKIVREMTHQLQSADHEHQSLGKQAEGQLHSTHTSVQAGISEKEETRKYNTNSVVHKTFNDPGEVTTLTGDTVTNEDLYVGGTTVLYDGNHFSKKKKKKRQKIQEELERIMYSPSNFNESNMYLSYAHLED